MAGLAVTERLHIPRLSIKLLLMAALIIAAVYADPHSTNPVLVYALPALFALACWHLVGTTLTLLVSAGAVGIFLWLGEIPLFPRVLACIFIITTSVYLRLIAGVHGSGDPIE